MPYPPTGNIIQLTQLASDLVVSRSFKFSIPTATCISCTNRIENAVRNKNICGLSINLSFLYRTATVEVENTNFSDNDIKNIITSTIREAGYECNEIQSEEVNKLHANPLKKTIWQFIKGLLGTLTGSVLFAICAFSIPISFPVMLGIGIASSLLTFYLGKEAYWNAIKDIRLKKVSVDTLFSISTLVALGISITSLFLSSFPMMFDAALLTFGLRHIGEVIKENARNKLLSNGLAFSGQAPVEVVIAEEGYSKKLVKMLTPGDVIILQKGDIVPVNGKCQKKALFYTTIRTGNPLPEPIEPNNKIYAGYKFADSDAEFIELEATAPQSESFLVQLDNAIEEANRKRAPLVIAADQILEYFVPFVLALAVISAIIIGTLFSPLTALQCAATLLASACPCTFGLITPLAVHIGITKAAKEGVIFKNGQTLQAAEQIDTVVFDLNGTLTKGAPQVISAKNITAELASYIAAIENEANHEPKYESKHPFAKAILQYIKKNYPQNSFITTTLPKIEQYYSGIMAKVGNEEFILGNFNMMQKQHIAIDNHHLPEIKKGQHVIYLARNKVILGHFIIEDPLRKDAKTTITRLMEMGKNIHLCTGADQDVAEKYASELNIPVDNVKGNCFAKSNNPNETKQQYIKMLKEKGQRVAMVGDAANDVAAVTESDFSIAVESDSSHPIVKKEAGAIIKKINNELSLRPVVTSFTVAQQAVRNIKQNILISLVYNILMPVILCTLLVGIGFVINPALGALLMAAQASLLTANIFRFSRSPIAANDCCYEVVRSTNKQKQGNTANIMSRLPSLAKATSKAENNKKPTLLKEGIDNLFKMRTEPYLALKEQPANTQLSNKC